MKQKDSVLKADSLTIVSDSESVTFGTVKQWEQLSGDGLSSLQRFAIVATFDDEETMYFVLEDINPFHFVPSEPMFMTSLGIVGYSDGPLGIKGANDDLSNS